MPKVNPPPGLAFLWQTVQAAPSLIKSPSRTSRLLLALAVKKIFPLEFFHVKGGAENVVLTHRNMISSP